MEKKTVEKKAREERANQPCFWEYALASDPHLQSFSLSDESKDIWKKFLFCPPNHISPNLLWAYYVGLGYMEVKMKKIMDLDSSGPTTRNSGPLVVLGSFVLGLSKK